MKVCLPVAEGRRGGQALALAAAAIQADHLGVHTRLIEEHEPMWLLLHSGLAVRHPDTALVTNVGACALRGHQAFFDL
jgi:hypothetical protein